MIKPILLFVLTNFFFHYLLAQPPASYKNRIEQVENSLLPYVPVKGFTNWNLLERMQFYRVPGLSIAVIHNFRIDWAKAYGRADTAQQIPVTTQTMFSAGSISKLVTAVAALQMVDKKQVQLNQPINNYLTSWKLPESEHTNNTPITLRLLLSHQAGTSQAAYFGFTPNTLPVLRLTDILKGVPAAESRPVIVNGTPGKEFRYSGGGYLVVQQAIMDVTHKDFADITQETIFKRLGMRQTTFKQPLPPSFQKYSSWAYSDNSWFKGMPYIYPQQAAAGLYSTPTDLAQLIITLQKSYQGKSKFLPSTLVRKMFTPQVTISNGVYKEEMGLGAFLLQRSDNKKTNGVYFEHTGVNAGFLAYAIGNIAEGNGVVIMMNKDGAADELGKEIRRAVAKVYHWTNFLPDEIKPITLPESKLNQYVGRYQRAPDEVVSFRRENNYLVETINQGNPIYCFPIGLDTIAFSDYPYKGIFRRNSQDEVVNLEIVEQQKVLPRLTDDNLLPNELMQKGRISEAKAGYQKLQLNEYQLTYMAYEFMHQKPAKLKEAESILQLANERYSKSGIVLARWGDLYLMQDKKAEAVQAYQQALADNPQDKELQEKLNTLVMMK